MMNIMNPPADWSTLKKLIWLRGTPINGGEELTVSGQPPLSLPNSLGKPLKAWSVDVLPYQEGSGDPAPDNVRPIHGTDKVTITTAGMNLMPDGFRQNGTSRVELAESVGNYINLPAGTYTLSFDFAQSALPSTYYAKRGEAGVRFVDSFTLSEAGEYNFWLYKSSSQGGVSAEDVSNVQLELGSTATPYTPYLAPSQTVITLPSTVYTATIGSEGGESRWGEVDLGTLTWYYQTVNQRFYTTLPSANTTWGTPKLLCESYNPAIWGIVQGDTSRNNVCAMDGTYVLIRDTQYTDVSTFKTAVTGIKLVYELATPTTFSVPSPTIPTPTGTATTWAMAEDGTVDSMEVTYVGKA